MAAFVAGLLGFSEQEFHFRVQRANHLTVAPLLSLYHSISPLLGLTASSDDVPVVAAVDEAVPLSTSSQPAQLLEDADGEQNHAQSDASALEPLSLNSDAKSQEGELQLTLCEQGLCGRGEALPQRGERERERLDFCLEEGLAGREEALPKDGEGSQWVGREVADLSLARGAASIAQLDGGCLVKILSHVDNKTLQACSLVCREWLEVSSFARTLMSLQEGPQITALPSLVARFSRLQSLHIQGPKTETIPAWFLPEDYVAPEQPRTDLANIVPLNDFGMDIIARGCRGLCKLELEWCSGFSDVGLAAVLRGCSELLDLSLAYCGGFSGEGAFAGVSCRLEKLVLDACDKLTNEGLLAAAVACPQLRDLSVLMDKENDALAVGLEGAARSCRGLHALMIHACGISDATLRAVAVSCPQLQQVTVTCEPAVTHTGLTAFFERLPKLEELTLQNMEGLVHLPRFRAGRCLKKLRLGIFWDVPDEVLREVSEETNLEELLLISCHQLTDVTVDMIFAGCKRLKRLVLYDNELVSTESIAALHKSGRKVKLVVGECPGSREGAFAPEWYGEMEQINYFLS
ncbi:F-box/RNI-like superfamily protein [Klebsormidium nitens]|uniref:F-box/RNI-like superfamily protein n=1 Tax=Klebsormidium nitens TaxID=105231 RepID=A0A1Y1IEF4_KLENI|nr:F-box/RNI-like superfamily protein [Klebsormidium nitens]|eukprot:GAQ89345.1 F-box/RNI-like superfamily protein [Klebsormidium nitens]